MFNIVEGIVRILDSLGNAITSTTLSSKQALDVNVANAPSVKLQDGVGNNVTATTDGSSKSLDSHVTNLVGAPVNTAVVVSGAAIDPRAVPADVIVTGTITAAGQSVKITVAGYPSRGIVVSGSWAGSLVCEASSDNEVTWSAMTVRSGDLSAEQGICIPQILSAISANGNYKPNKSGGLTHLRVRAASFTIGSASISIVNSSAPHMFNFGQQAIIQAVTILEQNSSVLNLLAGATFTGAAENTLGVAGIQVSLFADQNCLIYVEQSPDNTPHWDITDSYQYYANTSFGITVQAINSYVHVRVTNQNATTATTTFRLQTVLCPIVEALPRSLDSNGHLKVATQSIKDGYGFEVENTPTGEMRTVTPVRLVGTTFEGSTIDSNFWTVPTPTAAATVTQANTIVTLATGLTINGACQLHSVRRARFGEVAALQVRMVAKLSTGVSGNKRRWGVGYGLTMPTITEGAYFYLNGTTFGVGILSGGVEAPVNSGSFNGVLGITYTPNGNYEVYEIYYSGVDCYFVINGRILHTIPLTTTPHTATLNHYLYTDNVNTSISSNNTIAFRIAAIRRLGVLHSQLISKYQSGTTTGVICKRASGNLSQIIISGVTNDANITVYDGTTTGGTVIWSSGVMNAGGNLFRYPLSIDFKGVPFYDGLFFTITGANCNAMLIYE